MIASAFTCPAPTVSDADTIRCGSTRVRIAGISALERDGRCNSAPDCATMPYAQAKRVVERLIAKRTLTCQPVGRSYKRVVARCRLSNDADLSCGIIATGAAVRWELYWSRYRMGMCP